MNINQILELPTPELKKHIVELAQDYKNKTGNSTCLSCPANVQAMLRGLKNIYQKGQTQFRFKNEKVMYRIDGEIISNDEMTNEKAIKFLKKTPSRIELFSKYPSDWKKSITKKKPCNCKKRFKKTNK